MQSNIEKRYEWKGFLLTFFNKFLFAPPPPSFPVYISHTFAYFHVSMKSKQSACAVDTLHKLCILIRAQTLFCIIYGHKYTQLFVFQMQGNQFESKTNGNRSVQVSFVVFQLTTFFVNPKWFSLEKNHIRYLSISTHIKFYYQKP